jgi:succinate dehydrogenase/fumarate reductase-like Fe-S protein
MDIYQRWLLYAILFGIIVIVIWVAQWINRRKSEHRRFVIKTGPKVERFVDPAKAVRQDVSYTLQESKGKAIQWWEQSGLTEGICGVCNCAVNNPSGYLIPLSMVAKSTSYLEIAVKPIMEFGVTRDQAITQVKEQIMSERAPWLVCDNCKNHFFDK